jgi:hypothetical protein
MLCERQVIITLIDVSTGHAKYFNNPERNLNYIVRPCFI